MSHRRGSRVNRSPSWVALMGLCVVIAVTCVACTFGGAGSQAEHEAAVVTAVRQADERVVDVHVQESISGFASGWTIDIVLSGADPVTAQEYGDILRVARDANQREPDYIDLFATSEDGSSFDLTAPADELGITYTGIGAGVSTTSIAMDDAFGPR